jgi:NAD(P)-dependent dehydrogenase (short-subunit alcohol dehydrogenase family)
VGLFDVNEKELRAVAEAIGESSCRYQALDVTDPVKYEHAIKYFGGYTGQTMDVLFNCAGITSHGPFEAVALDDLLRIVYINVNGTIIGIHLSMELLRNTPGARIINMSSASAFYGTPDLAVYSASKFAIRGLTEALNIECQRHGISVSDIMPLYVDTPMVANQAYRPGSLDLFGIRLTAAQVAKVVWKTAHGTKVHWSSTFTVTMIDALSRLFPPLQRAALKFISGKQAWGCRLSKLTALEENHHHPVSPRVGLDHDGRAWAKVTAKERKRSLVLDR